MTIFCFLIDIFSSVQNSLLLKFGVFNFTATNDLLKVVARSCGHDDVNKFQFDDLSTFNWDIYKLTGISYAGVNS